MFLRTCTVITVTCDGQQFVATASTSATGIVTDVPGASAWVRRTVMEVLKEKLQRIWPPGEQPASQDEVPGVQDSQRQACQQAAATFTTW